jgi:hypothetical protein
MNGIMRAKVLVWQDSFRPVPFFGAEPECFLELDMQLELELVELCEPRIHCFVAVAFGGVTEYIEWPSRHTRR